MSFGRFCLIFLLVWGKYDFKAILKPLMIRTLFWWLYLLIFNLISHFQGGKIKNYILGFYLMDFHIVFYYIIVLMCKDAYLPFSHDVVWSLDWVNRLSCSLFYFIFIMVNSILLFEYFKITILLLMDWCLQNGVFTLFYFRIFQKS